MLLCLPRDDVLHSTYPHNLPKIITRKHLVLSPTRTINNETPLASRAVGPLICEKYIRVIQTAQMFKPQSDERTHDIPPTSRLPRPSPPEVSDSARLRTGCCIRSEISGSWGPHMGPSQTCVRNYAARN